MTKFKITFDKETCIGTFACNSVAERFFSVGEDKKAILNSSNFNEETNKFELIIDESHLETTKEAENLCPVLAIKVEKIEE